MIKGWIRKYRAVRGLLVLAAAAAFLGGCVYVFWHNPMAYPIPCMFHALTGLYCPGCGSGRACYALLHGHIYEAFCYNPLMLILLPFFAVYLAARCIDWVVTGGDHIDRKIPFKLLLVILMIVMVYGGVRNIPLFPFNLLAPGGLLGKS